MRRLCPTGETQGPISYLSSFLSRSIKHVGEGDGTESEVGCRPFLAEAHSAGRGSAQTLSVDALETRLSTGFGPQFSRCMRRWWKMTLGTAPSINDAPMR